MATAQERSKLAQLIGKALPVGDAEPAAYTDDELDSLLAAVPGCDKSGGADVYLAASRELEDKALRLELAGVEAGGAGPLVDSVGQGSANVSYHRPVPLGTTKLAANDPGALRILAARLARKSCRGGFRSADVAPPMVVRPGVRDAPDYLDPDWQDPHLLKLDPFDNTDRVLNLPTQDV